MDAVKYMLGTEKMTEKRKKKKHNGGDTVHGGDAPKVGRGEVLKLL